MVRRVQPYHRAGQRIQPGFMPPQAAQAVVTAIVARSPGQKGGAVFMSAATWQDFSAVTLNFPQAQAVQAYLRVQAQEYYVAEERDHRVAPATQ